LELWIAQLLTLNVEEVCGEMIKLTNEAFGTNSDVKPVFLLDNAHMLARHELEVVSTFIKGHKHTKLSHLLSLFNVYRPPCIVAGTADGNLEVVAEYSGFIPVPVYLRCLSITLCHTMGVNLVVLGNSQHRTDITFLDEKDSLFIAMTYATCQIPRLLKIAYSCWYNGKVEKHSDAFIFENFEVMSRFYYKDAISFIQNWTDKEVAMLMLSCSVNFKMYTVGHIPSTALNVKHLIDISIIFPYVDSSYVIPAFFWLGLKNDAKRNEEMDLVLKKWDTVLNEMANLIPGLEFGDLYIYYAKWQTGAYNLHQLGLVWEKLIASSLAVKYYLHTLGTAKPILMTTMYRLGPEAQAYQMLSELSVDLSGGIITPMKEVIAMQHLDPGVYLNSNSTTAHHDIILSGPQKTPNIAVQCKNSLTAPDGSCIGKQLSGCQKLIWIYPGYGEEEKDPPKQFQVTAVKKSSR